MTPQVWVGIVGLIVTILTLLTGSFYKLGHVAARVEELEKWRINMRSDMHEISDKLELMTNELKELHILMEERTERRVHVRATNSIG